MMMSLFYEKFPEIAEKETRTMILPEKSGVPAGRYNLLESYCNDASCDCRRVFVNIEHEGKIFATIGYGWEDKEFYARWMGERELAEDLKGPILELGAFTQNIQKTS